MNLKHIAEGWAKKLEVVPMTDAEKALAKERINICAVCPIAKEQWLTKFIDGILKNDELGSGIGCGICKCPINAKVLVNSEKCPLAKW